MKEFFYIPNMTNRIGGDNYIRDEKFNKIADEVMDQIWGQFMLTILNNPEKISMDLITIIGD